MSVIKFRYTFEEHVQWFMEVGPGEYSSMGDAGWIALSKIEEQVALRAAVEAHITAVREEAREVWAWYEKQSYTFEDDMKDSAWCFERRKMNEEFERWLD